MDYDDDDDDNEDKMFIPKKHQKREIVFSDLEKMTEFDFINYIDNNVKKLFISLLEILPNLLKSSNYEFINVEAFKKQVILMCKYISLKQRIAYLQEKIITKIHLNDGYYVISDHKFQSLDELEKAINMRSFL